MEHYQISWHARKGTDDNHDAFYKGWCNYSADFDLLQWIILNRTWSPIIWNDLRRNEESFYYSNLCVLDFDDCADLEHAVEVEFSEFKHIIGTTKRHGIKGDRFRVIIPWERKISDLLIYKRQMKKLATLHGTDKSACSGATKFLPCKDIVSVNETGKRMKVKLSKKEKIAAEKAESNASDEAKPWLVKYFLNNPVGDGNRHMRCFQLGKEAYRCGYTVEQTKNLVLQHGMISDWYDFNEYNLITAISGGFKDANKKRA